MQRIGVFVCWCGSNIAGTVDVKAVSEALATEPGVVFSTNYQYMCSQAGQDLIRNAIHEYKLTGIVICSCSPRMHEATFRKTAAAAGLNSYMVEIANVREQCSWVHKDKQTGTEKAIILGKAAVAKVKLNAPLTPGETPVTKHSTSRTRDSRSILSKPSPPSAAKWHSWTKRSRHWTARRVS